MLQNGGSRSLESSFNPIENKDSTPNDVTLLGAVDYLKKIKKLEDELEASSRKEKELTLNLAQRDSKCESLSKKLAEQQKE